MSPPRKRPENKKSSSYRERTDRITFSVPKGLPDDLADLAKLLDLNQSQITRKGILLILESEYPIRRHDPEFMKVYRTIKGFNTPD
jgi:hypothetical protein